MTAYKKPVQRAWLLLVQAGFIDAFVLRNVMKRQSMHLLTHCDLLDISDAKVGSLLNLPSIPAPLCPKGGCCHRVSVRMGQAAAHIATVFLAVAVVVGLLITATAMAWTQTAQLLCNTPTMIVEGGFLLIGRSKPKFKLRSLTCQMLCSKPLGICMWLVLLQSNTSNQLHVSISSSERQEGMCQLLL